MLSQQVRKILSPYTGKISKSALNFSPVTYTTARDEATRDC